MQIVNDAISQAVKECRQDELLAQAIIAWFAELANGNETTADTETLKRRLALLIKKTIVSDTE